MKIKKLKYISVFLLSLSFFSCDNYLDINEDPNNIHTEDINPRLILPGALSNVYRTQARSMNQLGNIWMQNWGADVNNFTSANNDEYSMAIDNTFYATIWDGLYPGVNNFQKIIDFNDPNYDNHKAVALIMKSFYMQYIVDLYGDAPYSQAFKGQENLTPAYDDDKAIYRSLITNIDTAMELFTNANAQDNALGTSDIIFGGNISEWFKFANTLKVRILLRQSGLTDTDTQTYLTDEFAKVAALNAFVTNDVKINPGYSSSTTSQLNPFFSLFRTAGTSPSPTQFDSYVRATDYVSRWFNGSVALNTNALNDPRGGKIYTLIGTSVAGAVQGDLTGPDPMSSIGSGLIVGANQSGYIMTKAEASFLLAEAIDKGYLPGGDAVAKSYFEAGISASFATLGAGSSAAYLAAIDSRPNIGWNGGNHTAAIMTQKWIATNGINAIESYIDYTRTGYPDVPLATSAQYTHKPYRLLYPTSEYVANSANVPNLVLSQVFTQGPFWKN